MRRKKQHTMKSDSLHFTSIVKENVPTCIRATKSADRIALDWSQGEESNSKLHTLCCGPESLLHAYSIFTH